MSGFNFYTLSPMERAVKEAVTSEGYRRELKYALDFNPDSYWSPSSTADQNVDLDINDCGELINDTNNSTFVAASDWANNNVDSYDESGDLSIAASASNQFCYLSGVEFGGGFYPGRRYEIQYDYSENTIGWRFQAGGSNEIIGMPVDGTGQVLVFEPTRYGSNLLLVSTNSIADGDFDNIYIREAPSRRRVEAYGLWLRDLNLNWNGSGTPHLTVSYSDDASTWTQYDQQTFSTLLGSTYRQGHLVLKEGGDTVYRRYWRFAFANMAAVAKIGMFMLFSKSSLGQGASYPVRTSYGYGNELSQPIRNRQHVRLGLAEPQYSMGRALRLVSTEKLAALEEAYQFSYGNGMPLVIDDNGTWHLARFTDQTFDKTMFDHQSYDVSFNFTELAHRNSEEIF